MADAVEGAAASGGEPEADTKKPKGGKPAVKGGKQAVKTVVKPDAPPLPKEDEKEGKPVRTLRICITGHVEGAKGLITGDVDMDIAEAQRLIRLGKAHAISR